MNPNAPVFSDNTYDSLTIRDYIAIEMMKATIIRAADDNVGKSIRKCAEDNKERVEQFIASISYGYADALIAESNKKHD